MITRFVGIDPGRSGAVAVIDHSGVSATRMPLCKSPTGKTIIDTNSLWQTLAGLDPAYCVLERVSASPNMGVTSAFKFGLGYGALLMGVEAAGLDWEQVTPQVWQREFDLIVKGRTLGKGDTEKKRANKERAKVLFPELQVFGWNADALLIAEYARRKFCLLDGTDPTAIEPMPF